MTTSKADKVLSNEELEACEQNEKWICPVNDCRKELSRKQTLKTHLQCIHSIEAGSTVKRYKKYEVDECEPKPKTTKWRCSRLEDKKSDDNIQSETFASCHDNTIEDFTVYSGDYNPCDEVQYSVDGNSCVEEVQNPEEYNPCGNDIQDSAYCNPCGDEVQEILMDNVQVEDMDIVNNIDSDYENDSNISDEESADKWSSDDDSEKNDENQRTNSVPLYVLPPKTSIYSSDITHQEHLLSLCAYSTKNNLSGTAFSQLMQIVNIHVPEKNLCELNVNKVKRKLGFTGFMKYIDYCEICGAIYSEAKEITHCSTPNCTGRRNTDENKGHGKNYFVTGDLSLQLVEIIENNWEQIITSLNRENVDDGIYDILDGRKYKEIKEKCKKMTITLTMFTDGVSLFKSSKVSIWPVYLIVNELQPSSRFIKKNMVLWGLWQGQGKPKMNTFFFPFVKEVRSLYDKGLKIDTTAGQQTVYVIVNAITMDLQARSSVFNMTQHNGMNSCIFCEEPGHVVKSGKGHTRCFPYREVEDRPNLRTNATIEQHVLQAVDSRKPACGFFGRSIIKHLPFVNLNESCTVDYMHGILLGITKKLLSLWISGSSYQQPFFIGHKLKDLDRLLKNIKVPYLIHRIPRKIENNINHWKASEFRSFLLFYALPCLNDILPKTYLDHFSCLVEATFLLLKQKITPKDLRRADLLLNIFYKCIAQLYGDAVCGLNVHNLSHLVKIVEDWGPLWTFSCFSFESFNGEISKAIHGKGNVSGEVYWTVHSEKIIERQMKELNDGRAKQLIEQITRSSRHVKDDNLEIGEQCLLVKPLIKIDNLEVFNTEIKEQLSNSLDTSHEELIGLSFFKVSKIQRNNFTFYSEACGKVKQRNSFTILLHSNFKGCSIVQVQYYLHVLNKNIRKTFAVGNGFEKVSKVVQGHAYHLDVIEMRRENLVIPTSLLEELVVYMEIERQQTVGQFPNFVEKD